MLQTQVDYWQLQETKRHNLATEAAGFQQARASEMSAQAAQLQADVAKQTVPIKQYEAESSAKQAEAALRQAKASLMNAKTNQGNLEVNRGNLEVNKTNAQTNIRNADINQQNADTNRYNADINAWNAATNAYNAEINKQNADTNAYNAQTNRMVGVSEITLNHAKTGHEVVLTEYDTERIEGQRNENVISGEAAKYAHAKEIIGMVDTGSHVINNVGSGVGGFLRGAGNIISAVNSASKDSNSYQQSGIGTFLTHLAEPSTKYFKPSPEAGKAIVNILSLF